MAPYETDPAKWWQLPWIDIHGGKRYRVTTIGNATEATARLQTYRAILQAYEHHSEVKSAAADGTQANQSTVGLLGRVHVHELERVHTGKESNRLEDVDAGDVHDLDDVLTTYAGPGTDAFTLRVKPILDLMPAAALARAAGVSTSYAHRIKAGRAPIPKTTASRKRLAVAAAKYLGLREAGTANLRLVCHLIAETYFAGRDAMPCREQGNVRVRSSGPQGPSAR